MRTMEAPVQKDWNKPCPPQKCEDDFHSSAQRRPRPKRYDVEPASYTLFIGAAKAKKANWPTPEVRPETKVQPSAPLPPENIAAIQLLDSWLNEDVQDHSKEWEEIKQTIEENRLSDRKLFS
jgi:hypothetical protein